MKKILVSGTSGIVGYGILRSLKNSSKNLLLIGTTIYDDSVAPAFCDIFEKALPTNDEGYIAWLTTIIKKHKIDFLIPGIEADLYKWAEHVPEIEKTGAKILVNNKDLISLCKDKWLFYEQLKKIDSPYAIESSLVPEFEFLVHKFGLPFLLKPRQGFGSKGIVTIDSKENFLHYRDKVGSVLMAQPIIGTVDEEYTTSAFCDGNGGFYNYMTLRRKLSKDGFTDKAEVVNLPELKEVLSRLCSYFKPVGPTNFQFRRRNGVFKLLEINPRISSSTSIRSAFGYNESLMAVEYFLENKIPQEPLIREGKAVRYTDDFIFYK